MSLENQSEIDKAIYSPTIGEGLAGLVLVLGAENRDITLVDKVRCIGNFAVDTVLSGIKHLSKKINFLH